MSRVYEQWENGVEASNETKYGICSGSVVDSRRS